MGVRKEEGVGRVAVISVCMSRRRWWVVGPVLCAVIVWAGDCLSCVVGWKISSYWLDKSECVVRDGRLYWTCVAL